MCVSEFMPNNKSLKKTHLQTLGKNAIDQCNNPERSIAAQINARELAGHYREDDGELPVDVVRGLAG